MKVKCPGDNIRDFSPRSIVGSKFVGQPIDTKVNIDGIIYELVEK